MASSDLTPRFQIPIPPWDADWQKWQQVYRTFSTGVDAVLHALLEHQALLPVTLPDVEIVVIGPAASLHPHGVATFLSRTYGVPITVPAVDVPLVHGAMLALSLQPGAVGPQTATWQVLDGAAPVDSSLVCLGVVDAVGWTIRWFNGNQLAIGDLLPLFGGAGGGGLGPGDTGTLYVDATNGADAPGRGSWDRPFQTLPYAAGTVAVPTNYAEFDAPCAFHLEPGTYAGDWTVPRRRTVTVIGNNAHLTGNAAWNLRAGDWFGTSADDFPATLAVTGGDNCYCHWDEGGIDAVNAVPGAVGVGANHILILRNVRIDEQLAPAGYFRIWNHKSGALAAPGQTGRMLLFLENVYWMAATRGDCIFGEYDDGSGGVNGVPGYFGGDNSVRIAATDSVLITRICGNIYAEWIRDCKLFAMRRDLRPDVGAPTFTNGYKGCIQGGTAYDGLAACELYDSTGFPSGGYVFNYDNAPIAKYPIAPDVFLPIGMDAQTGRNYGLITGVGDSPYIALRDAAEWVSLNPAAMTGHVLPEDINVQDLAERVDGLVGTAAGPGPVVDLWVDPTVGSDANAGDVAHPLATVTMALRRIGVRPIRCATRVHVLPTLVTDVLPRTIPITLADHGSFALIGEGSYTQLYVGQPDAPHVAVGPNGYVGTRVPFLGAPGWADDAWVGCWLRPGTGDTYEGQALRIARSGTDWVEVLVPYSVADVWVAADTEIVEPSVVLTQSYACEIVVTQAGSSNQARYAGPLNTVQERARVAISNLVVDYDAPGGAPVVDRAPVLGLRGIGDDVRALVTFVAVRARNLPTAKGSCGVELAHVRTDTCRVWDDSGVATVAGISNLTDPAGAAWAGLAVAVPARADGGVLLRGPLATAQCVATNGLVQSVAQVTRWVDVGADAFTASDGSVTGSRVLAVGDDHPTALTLAGCPSVVVGTATLGVGAVVTDVAEISRGTRLRLSSTVECAAAMPDPIRIGVGCSVQVADGMADLVAVAGAYQYEATDPITVVAAWPVADGAGTTDGLGAFVVRR